MRKLLFGSLLLFSLSNAKAITLRQAVTIALENNPTLKALRLKVRAGKLKRRLNKSELFGKVFVTGGFTRFSNPRPLIPLVPPITGPVPSDRDIKNLNINYDVQIKAQNFVRLSVDAANERAISERLKAARSKLSYNVASLYLKALYAKEEAAVLKSHIKTLKTLKDIVKTAYKSGSKSQLDVMKVDSEITSLEAKLVQLKENYKNLLSNLSYLLGGVKVKELEGVGNDTCALPNFAYGPDVKAAGFEFERARRQVKKAESSYFPALEFKASLGRIFGGGESEKVWQIGAYANWVVFDFGLRSAAVELAKEEEASASLKVEDAKLSSRKDFENALSGVRKAKEALKSAKEQLKLAQKIRELELSAYKSGSASMYDLLKSEDAVLQAKSDVLKARFDLLDACYFAKSLVGEVVK